MRSLAARLVGIGTAALLTVAVVASTDEPLAAAGVAYEHSRLAGVGFRGSTPAGRVAERAATCRVTPEGSSTGHPLLVVVGASFTAGVGPDRASLSWGVRLGELLDWRAVTLGVPGAGYTNAGLDHLGPLAREVDVVHLGSLHPRLVIIQAGYDDWRVSPAAEARNVARLVRQLERAAPRTSLVFLTAFSSRAHRAWAPRVGNANSTIVRTIRASDPTAIIIDPLHWRFPRAGDGLHPTAAGDLIVAEHVAHALLKTGAVPTVARRPRAAKVKCKTLGRRRLLGSKAESRLSVLAGH